MSSKWAIDDYHTALAAAKRGDPAAALHVSAILSDPVRRAAAGNPLRRDYFGNHNKMSHNIPRPAAKPVAGKIRERELVQSELPANIQAPFRPGTKPTTYAQMPDGAMQRENAFVLPSFVNLPPPELAGQALSMHLHCALLQHRRGEGQGR